MLGSKNKKKHNMKAKLINLNKIIQSQIKISHCLLFLLFFLFLVLLLLFWNTIQLLIVIYDSKLLLLF